MLKKMWEGDLDLEDRKRINTRVIGYNGLELPSMLQGEYKIIQIMNNFSYLPRIKLFRLWIIFLTYLIPSLTRR